MRRPLALGASLLAVLALAAFLPPRAWPQAHTKSLGPPPARMSPGAKHIEAMTFPPLKLTIPRVGREVERLELANGLVLYLMEDHTLPVFDLQVVVRTGSLYTFRDKPGLAGFAGDQMREGGTKAYPPEELNRRLEHMAASIETGVGIESLTAGLSCLSKDMDEGLALFAEVFLRPRFDEAKLELAKQQHREGLRRRNDRPGAIVHREFEKLLFTEGHPYGHELRAEEADAITREDLLAFHRRYVRPGNSWMAVVGDFDRSTIVGKLERALAGWERAEVPLPPPEPVTPRPIKGVYLGDKDLTQSFIVVGHYGIARHNPDRYAITLMNYLLGGSGFTSRIMQRVRGEEGLAYDARTAFPTGGPVVGTFRAVSQTKPDTAERTIRIILEEIERLRSEPPGGDELKRAKEAFINSFVFTFTDPVGNVVKLMNLEFLGYPPDFYETLLDKYRAVTPADIRRVAQKYLHPDKVAIVVVGPREPLAESLRSFGSLTTLDLSLEPLKVSRR